MESPRDEPLELPCGTTSKNRIAKSAMTEGLADANDDPTREHATPFGRWAGGGAGLLITGDVMVDRRFLERPGNVGLDETADLKAMAHWVSRGRKTAQNCGCN